jgi:hypothetical protein
MHSFSTLTKEKPSSFQEQGPVFFLHHFISCIWISAWPGHAQCYLLNLDPCNNSPNNLKTPIQIPRIYLQCQPCFLCFIVTQFTYYKSTACIKEMK